MYIRTLKNIISERRKGGVKYERFKYLKSYAEPNDRIMQAYLEYARYAFWRGGISFARSSLFETDLEYVSIYDVKIPKLRGRAVSVFWSEFGDILLPYILEMRGQKHHFSEIDPLIDEGPYELNDKVSVNKNDVVFDCGANLGLFSAVAAAKGAQVFAFEPDPDVRKKYLNKTAQWNGGIRVCGCALGNRIGEAVFQDSGDAGLTAGRLQKDGNPKGIVVKIQTIDNFVEKNHISNLDFIKADIEGAERDMLRGAVETIRKYRPKLSVCTYHLPDDREVLEKIVKEAYPGYHIRHEYKKMYCWA